MPPDDLPDDLQRPLDESLPARLRPAVPADPDARTPEPTAPQTPAPETPVPETSAAETSSPEATAQETRAPDASATETSEPDASATETSEPAASEPDPTAAETSEPDPTAPETTGPETPATNTTATADVATHVKAGLGAVLVRVVHALAWASRSAARAAAAWSRSPSGRFAVPGLLIATLVGGAGVAGGLLVPAVSTAGGLGPGPATTAPVSPGLPPVPPSGAPPLGPSAPPGQNFGPPLARAEALHGWAEQTSTRTGIPVLALQAYGYAELVVGQTHPSCQLSWTTLAAIGRVESNHGSSGGARLLPDGRTDPTIVGLPLDGLGDRLLIADTDGGAMDGDTVYDRAVGPLQFIPSTWRGEAIDATGDGVADVHNINDAALAAANYLCRHGRDLTTPTGWWGAVLAYNNVQAYADEVFAAANEYGQLSRT